MNVCDPADSDAMQRAALALEWALSVTESEGFSREECQEEWALVCELRLRAARSTVACTTGEPARGPYWDVSMGVYDGDSDEYGRARAHTMNRQPCAPDAFEALAIVRREFEDCDVLWSDAGVTYPLVRGDGRESCI